MASRRRLELLMRVQRHRDPAEVDQVEPDDEEVVDRVGQHFLAVERIDQEARGRFCTGSARPR